MRLGRICKYTAEGFDLVKDTGLDFTEVCCNHQADMEDFIAAKDDIKAQIARTGIDISCVGRWNHDIQENGRLNPERLISCLQQKRRLP